MDKRTVAPELVLYLGPGGTIVDSTLSHRIAQCSSVRVTILEGEPIPIQVDGEAWLQEPGVIQIKHKVRVKYRSNRVKYLIRLGTRLWLNEIIKNRVHMLAKAKQGHPARDEVIDLTDDEIELLSKQANLLLQSFSSRFV